MIPQPHRGNRFWRILALVDPFGASNGSPPAARSNSVNQSPRHSVFKVQGSTRCNSTRSLAKSCARVSALYSLHVSSSAPSPAQERSSRPKLSETSCYVFFCFSQMCLHSVPVLYISVPRFPFPFTNSYNHPVPHVTGGIIVHRFCLTVHDAEIYKSLISEKGPRKGTAQTLQGRGYANAGKTARNHVILGGDDGTEASTFPSRQSSTNVYKGSNSRSDRFNQTFASEYFARIARFFFLQHSRLNTPRLEMSSKEQNLFSSAGAVVLFATRLSIFHTAHVTTGRDPLRLGVRVLRALSTLGHFVVLVCTMRWANSPIY